MKRASSTPSAAAIKRASSTLSASQPPLKIPAKDSGPAPVPQLKVKPLPVKRFKHGPVEERQYAVELPSRSLLGRGVGILVALNTALEGAFRRMLQDAPPGSRVQARIHNPNLHKHYISSPRLPREQLRLDHLTNKLMAALQSDESIDLETTKFTLSIFNELTVGWSAGSLWSRLEHNIHVFLKSKRSICNPISTKCRVPPEFSQMCVPLAIVRELYALENPGLSRAKVADFARSVAFRDRALQLVRDAGLVPEFGPFTFKQLVLFGKALPSDVGLNIFDDCGPPVVRCGPLGPRCINLFIAYNPPNEDNLAAFHAYSINSIKAFMNVKSFCLNCFKADNHYNRSHKCPAASCKLCKFVNCPNRENEKSEKSIQCELCLFSFSTQCCFDTHLLEKACDKVAKCPLCAQVFPPEKMDKHPCGRSYCPLCKKRHLPFEHCYVQGKKTKGTAKPPLSIWYADTECQEDPETKQHHANLVVLQHTNSQGEVTSFEYKGPNAMAEFTADCIKKGSQYSDSVVVFHNAAGYDAHLWFQELRKAKSPPKHVILKEQKLIAMELRQNGIKCRDSLQFLPGTPLAAFPDMFELQSGPKGDFPHRLNTPKWIQWGQKLVYREVVDGVEHRFPLLAYFRPESKRPKQLQALKQWHSEMVAKYQGDPNLTYIPEEELLKYCYQDVRILREGFDKYRETWLEQYPSLEPLDSITFPSFNNRIYREVYMPEDSLCLLPPPGYSHKNRPYSKPAMAWLAWKQRELKLTEMRTARHAYEVKINGHFVDGTGVDRLGQRHVFECHGCFYHGCPCNKKRTPLLDARLERTRAIDLKMQALGDNPESPYGSFKYHIIWECDFNKAKKQDPLLEVFVADYYRKFPREPLQPRSALRGGRTEPIKHRVQVDSKAGYRLFYDDFTSLYPSVNFSTQNQEWPIGHPDIFIGKDLELAPDVSDWLGFASARILPPRQLKHPVLGQVINDKLLFHLCSTCAQDCNSEYCNHTDDERVIEGTFFTGEIQMALSKGYKLLQVNELWNWPPSKRSQELFRGLIRDQYARKALSSAVPSDPVEFQRLLDEYKRTMQLDLDPKDFRENKALRALAKFSLNNIWGYLGKRNDVTQTEFTQSYARALELDNDPDVELTTLLSDDCEFLTLVYKDKNEQASRNGNICIAAMTTAYARLELYKIIDKYSEQVVYMDTDSVFLLLPPGMEPPPTSTVLGELKDEIHEEFGPGSYISSFSSIGPKSYTFQVDKDGQKVKEVLKFKGISLTAQALNVVNPAVLQQMTTDHSLQLNAPQSTIRKDIHKGRLWTADFSKQVRFSSNKRYIPLNDNEMMDSWPFGYCL